MGVYKPIVICGNMAYLSGHGPLKVDKTLITGRLGLDMDVEAGYEAARTTGLAMLATLQSEAREFESCEAARQTARPRAKHE